MNQNQDQNERDQSSKRLLKGTILIIMPILMISFCEEVVVEEDDDDEGDNGDEGQVQARGLFCSCATPDAVQQS